MATGTASSRVLEAHVAQSNGNQERRPWQRYVSDLLESSSQPILILDAAGSIVFANDAACRLFRARSAAFLIGRRHEDSALFHDATLHQLAPDGTRLMEEFHHSVASAGSTPDAFEVERFVVERPDGTSLFLSAEKIPLHADMGSLAGIGVIYTDITEEIARKTENDWLYSDLIAARLQIEELLRLSESLNRLADSVHSAPGVDELLDTVLAEASGAIGAHSAMVQLPRERRWVIRAARNMPKKPWVTATLPGLDSLVNRHEPLVTQDAFEDERFDGALMRTLDLRSVLAVPLLFKEGAPGILSFHVPDRHSFSADQTSYAVKVAFTTALAMDNARVFARERDIADTLQRSLLVVPAAVEAVESAHCYESATETASVGGDFFDLFDLGADCLGVTVGDVSGKGVEASALASFTRQLIRAHAQEGMMPAEVLQRASDLVNKISRDEDFVTVFFGMLAPSTGEFVYSIAGHPTPLLLKDGRASLLPTSHGGPILGAYPDVRYTDESTSLGVGETLVLYTDGVIEARKNGVLLGEGRLLAIVESLSSLPITELASAVMEEVHEFASGQLRDDVAMLLVRRAPTADDVAQSVD